MTKLISISILLAAVFTLAASAPAIESPSERIATTRHQIKVGQKILRYTARAGLLPIKRNITTRYYEGGHAMYESPGARRQLKQDIDKFIQDTVGGRPRPQGARP